MTALTSADTRSAHPAQVSAAIARLEHTDGEVEIRETHISWLFLTAERAFKLKKPLVLDFVDYGTPARRHVMCREEVRLNARLAPEIYLDVRAVVDTGQELRIVDENDPAAVDYLVEMRRYVDRQTLSAGVLDGRLLADVMPAVARVLAEFHAACPVTTDQRGAIAVQRELDENLAGLLALLDTPAVRRRVHRLGAFLRTWADRHDDLLRRRGEAGRVREGHGDLRAEHIILTPAISIVDCVEFDAGLRTLDVADDLAFLVMDLCASGAEAFARQLMAEYRRAGGDCGPDALVWFFAVHRALVRAKVELVRAAQPSAAPRVRADARARANRLLMVAEQCTWHARGGLALVVCGAPASGKSYVCAALSAGSGLGILSSDVVRKRLAGLPAHARAPLETYRPEVNYRTYQELGRLAALAVSRDGVVVVDATFRHGADRAAFAESFADAAPVWFVQCLAPARVLAQRAAARDQDPDRLSDASADIVARERDAFEPLDEVSAAAHLTLRTDRAPEAVIADLEALLNQRL